MFALDAGVATLTLDRPERGNALSGALVEELHAGLARANSDVSAHTLVLRGEGRHFCTGFDLDELDTESDSSLLLRFVRIEMLLDALWRAPLRTVVLAQGSVTGAGADLFAACDLRLIQSDASLRFPGAGFGIVLGTRRLAARVGSDRALRWVSEATSISAQAAVETGLASSAASDLASAADALQTTRSRLERATYAALRAALIDSNGERDLAALVRSAAAPGLKARIVAYRDRVAAARAATR